MNKRKRVFTPVRCVFILLTAAVMILIFLFSCEDSDESSHRSRIATALVTKVLYTDFEELPEERQKEIMDKADHIVRKLAHCTIFAALGFCASCTVGERRIFSRISGGVLLFCFLYACSDELHQRFVPGRSGEFRDVMIDTSGSLIGILLSFIAIGIVTKMVSRHNSVKTSA
ncbi:MAG: VanZ family protein [Ruminococcus sp.]|nr:VanZ family protein [Ruminococcus sp.]